MELFPVLNAGRDAPALFSKQVTVRLLKQLEFCAAISHLLPSLQ